MKENIESQIGYHLNRSIFFNSENAIGIKFPPVVEVDIDLILATEDRDREFCGLRSIGVVHLFQF